MEPSEVKILLVDDEPDILEFLGYNLSREGYRVESANNGKEGLVKAMEFRPHVVILDVMMPGMDGMEVCMEMRKRPELRNVLVAFLTARGEDYSQIAGFDAGADDYITKPIKPRVFISRIQALLRRYKEEPVPSVENRLIVTNEFTIDRDRFVILAGNLEIFLPKKEFELLSFLVNQPNKVHTRDDIFGAVWGDDVVVGDRTIDVHIRRIREKLGIDSIKTIKGVGYKFEER